jgi:hypothetical protein
MKKKKKLEGQILGDNSCMSNPSELQDFFFSSRHHPILMFKKGTIMAIKP